MSAPVLAAAAVPLLSPRQNAWPLSPPSPLPSGPAVGEGPVLPAQVAAAVWRGDQLGQSVASVWPSGFAALDAELPGRWLAWPGPDRIAQPARGRARMAPAGAAAGPAGGRGARHPAGGSAAAAAPAGACASWGCRRATWSGCAGAVAGRAPLEHRATDQGQPRRRGAGLAAAGAARADPPPAGAGRRAAKRRCSCAGPRRWRARPRPRRCGCGCGWPRTGRSRSMCIKRKGPPLDARCTCMPRPVACAAVLPPRLLPMRRLCPREPPCGGAPCAAGARTRRALSLRRPRWPSGRWVTRRAWPAPTRRC
jgi:hypothetical protein